MLPHAPLRRPPSAAAIVAVGLLAATGCRRAARTAPGCDEDVHAAATGPSHLFAVDRIVLPLQRSDFADDLDGDGRADDQLGNVIALASAVGYRPEALVPTLVAAGRLAPRLE